MQIQSRKQKYNINDYATTSQGHIATQNFSKAYVKSNCLQKEIHLSYPKESCFKCKERLCACLNPTKLRNKQFECCSCIAKSMDLIYQVRTTFIQSYFQTESVFMRPNRVVFEFNLNFQDLNFPIEVRGLQHNKLGLSWPMQGSFYFNGNPEPLLDIKPLLINSNRKNRKEESFVISSQKLKQGKNQLVFNIPRLNPQKFKAKYQCEDVGSYYIGIFSVKAHEKSDIIAKVINENRLEKEQSLDLLKRMGDSDLAITKSIISLVCPYTKERIKMPVRGRYCQHFMCICLETLIMTQRSSRGWNCPLCSQKINEPYIDIWILEILSDNHQGIEIEISPEGTYNWIKTNVAEIALDDDDDDSIQPNRIEPIPQVSQPPKPKETLCVEIEDDDPIQIHQPAFNHREELKKQILAKVKRTKGVMPVENKQSEQGSIKATQAKNSKRKDIEKSSQNRNLPESIPKKAPMIIDVKTLYLKEVSVNQFARKVFKVPPEAWKKKLSEDLKKLFKQAI